MGVCFSSLVKGISSTARNTAQIRIIHWSVFPRIQLNTGIYGPEKIHIWTLFTQCSTKHF